MTKKTRSRGRERALPAANAFAYTIKDAQAMGAPGKSTIYELEAKGVLKLTRRPGLPTMVDGDSLRALLRADSDTVV